MARQDKVFEASDLQTDEGSRSIICTISTDAVDRHSEVVSPKGLIKKNYQGNPVVLTNHQYDRLPVGTCEWIKPSSADPRALIAKWHVGKTADANDIWTLATNEPPILRSYSIGFNVVEASPPTDMELETRPEWKDARTIMRKWELLEFSVVGIPANPECLMLAHSKGVSTKMLNWLDPHWESYRAKLNPWRHDPLPIPAPTPKTISIPTPKFSRSWSDIEKQIRQAINTPDDMLNKLRGRS